MSEVSFKFRTLSISLRTNVGKRCRTRIDRRLQLPVHTRDKSMLYRPIRIQSFDNQTSKFLKPPTEKHVLDWNICENDTVKYCTLKVLHIHRWEGVTYLRQCFRKSLLHKGNLRPLKVFKSFILDCKYLGHLNFGTLFCLKLKSTETLCKHCNSF